MVDLSIPGYIEAALHKYHQIHPKRSQHETYKWDHTEYSVNSQMVPDKHQTQPLTPDGIKLVHKVIGK